jgi:hypothetical protein
MRHSYLRCALLCAVLVNVRLLSASTVLAPDNGFGTATMPPAGQSYIGVLMQIINGLPPGSTIDMTNPSYGNFSLVTEVAGGGLGGTTSSQTASLFLPMIGTGAMSGYSRNVIMTLSTSTMDFAPRVPFAPVQVFAGDVALLQGQLPPGDPDFDLLRITAGSSFGMPSPGSTTLTQDGGNWNVDSFFDVIYRIDFVGKPGGPFGGMSGSTNGTTRFQLGQPIPEPAGIAAIVCAGLPLLRRRRG